MKGSGIREQGSGAPPRFADWILKRVLPLGKRGESILGDLHEECSLIPVPRSLIPSRSIWYWQQTLRLRHVLASQGGRGATATMRGRSVLVVAQVALAVMLLTASSLAIKSVRQAYGQPLGMSIDHLITFGMEFNDVIYPDPASASAAANQVRDALAALPGASRATMVSALPVLGDAGMIAITVDDRATMAGEATPTAVVTGARADAGQALGVPLLAGRWWDEGATAAAVISQAAAMRYFDGVQSAIGRHLSFQDGSSRATYSIVGVSGDVANTDRTSAAPPRVWIPMPHQSRRMTFMVEGSEPAALASGIRTVAARLSSAVPVEGLSTFREAMTQAESSDYVIIGTISGFALVALALATSGLFGVISYSVSQRTAEFGTRMALGAPASTVMAIVARQSLRMLTAGLAVGIAGGIAVGFAMRGMLFGISPADPATLLGVAGLLAVVSLAATALPAWRASRIDPMVALRSD